MVADRHLLRHVRIHLPLLVGSEVLLSCRSAEEEEEAERMGWVPTPMKRLGKLLTACSGPSASPPKPRAAFAPWRCLRALT